MSEQRTPRQVIDAVLTSIEEMRQTLIRSTRQNSGMVPRSAIPEACAEFCTDVAKFITEETKDMLVPPPHSAGVVVTDEMASKVLDAYSQWLWDEEVDPARCSQEAYRKLKLEAMRAALVAALGGEGEK